MAIDLNSGTLAGPVHTSLVAHTMVRKRNNRNGPALSPHDRLHLRLRMDLRF